MKNLLVKFLINSFAIMFIAWLIPGIEVANFLVAMFVCVVIAFINMFIKPIIKLITLPVTVFTLGLFSLVINAGMLWLASWVAEGFEVHGFVPALLGSLVLSIISMFTSKL